jgi:predicted outer membrane repeat protein
LHVSCKSSATLTNCTISGNEAVFRGGGIHSKGTLTLVHCTISGNRARGISRGQATGDTVAGGLAIRGKGVLSMTNTLIAGNPNDGDCILGSSAIVAINTHNLVGDGSCPSEYTGDPNLGLLTDNGGDTQTRALLPGSPAVDAIPAGACPVGVDQRGYARPASTRSPGASCDIGAFESQ